MKHLRYGILLLALGSALGPLGCPPQPLCPSCGLRLKDSDTATLSLSRIRDYEEDELLGITLTVMNEVGKAETHEYPPSLLPPLGQPIELEATALCTVGDAPTTSAFVTMKFSRKDAVTAEVPVACKRDDP